MRKLFGFMVLLFCAESEAYRFICNSMDAQGGMVQDKCGVCDDDTGPRWHSKEVRIKIDKKTLPRGLDPDTWFNLALSCMDSWNAIPGAELSMKYEGPVTERSMGDKYLDHDLYWITDVNEWRKKIGGGEKDTLGVTLSPYNCPNEMRRARNIVDADLVLNATHNNFNWKPVCDKHKSCDSIRSTLTHELGHFVGLGHPCKLCSWSVMTAKSGYHIEYPMFDDQQAFRAMYPGRMSGETGVSCDKNSECHDHICVKQDDAQFCSQQCTNDESCPDGYSCDEDNIWATGMCLFKIGQLVDAASLGDSCQEKLCKPGLICAGVNDKDSFCFSSCTAQNMCSKGEICAPLVQVNDKGVCFKVASLDEPCDEMTSCAKKLICVAKDNEQKGTCLAECTKSNPLKSCGLGGICEEVTPGVMACFNPGPKHEPDSKEPEDPIDRREDEEMQSFGCNSTGTRGGELISLLALLVLLFSLRLFKSQAKPN